MGYRQDIAPCEGIQDSLGFWIPCRGFQSPITGFRIPIVSGILDFYGCIPDSKAQDSGFRKPIPLHGEKDTHGAHVYGPTVH